MKNQQQACLVMCQRVKNFYSANRPVVDTVKEVANLFVVFTVMVDTLNAEFENSISYINKYTIERAKKRDDLEKSCLLLGRALNVQLQRDKSDGNRCVQGYDESTIGLLNEEELIEHASYLQDTIIAFEKTGTANNLNVEDIRMLSHRLTLFVLDLPMHRINIENRRNSSQAVIKSIADINAFFSNKLDVKMEKNFKTEMPSLYDQYMAARTIDEKPLETAPDFEGKVDGEAIHTIAMLKYDPYREMRLQITGGAAIWGLGYTSENIEFSRPIAEGENLSIKCSTIGKGGDFILLQQVNNHQSLNYKLWIKDV